MDMHGKSILNLRWGQGMHLGCLHRFINGLHICIRQADGKARYSVLRLQLSELFWARLRFQWLVSQLFHVDQYLPQGAAAVTMKFGEVARTPLLQLFPEFTLDFGLKLLNKLVVSLKIAQCVLLNRRQFNIVGFVEKRAPTFGVGEVKFNSIRLIKRLNV